MLEQFSSRMNFPYLHGVYLAINAIQDAWMVVDGPNCAFFKAERIFGAHDLQSTLLSVDGHHRIVNTDLNVDTVIRGHEDIFSGVLRRVLESGRPRVVFVGALPMASITGFAYSDIVEDLAAGADCPCLVLPARSLDRDWLHAYSDLLSVVARSIDLADGPQVDDGVAVVGYFMDRNEGDHRGNLLELRTLLGDLGLSLESCWLDGGSFQDLARASRARTVVSLPHGREAAAILSERTGANRIECEVPFGPEATERFLRRIAEGTGRSARVDGILQKRLPPLIRGCEWLIPRRFLHRRVSFLGDPFLAPGFVELASLLGMEVAACVACAKERTMGPGEGGQVLTGRDLQITWQPRIGQWRREFQAIRNDVDLVVSDGTSRYQSGLAGTVTRPLSLEFGFPSPAYHCCHDAPFLGYAGAAHFVDRMSNLLLDRVVPM